MTPESCFKLLLFFLWCLMKAIYDFLRRLTWRFTGIHHRLNENSQKQALNHEIAHVERILYRYSADKLASPTGLDYYITQHVKFVDPSYLLNPYVTLYSINSTHAIFVETAGVDVYDVEHGGVFSRVSQYEHAYYVISLPLWAFIAFEKELGHPKADMVMVCYTARCGSSLMLQALGRTKKCVVISEPDTLQVAQTLRGKVDESTMDDIQESIINLLCKPVQDESKKLYVLKFGQPGMANLPRIRSLFPEMKLLFMYRKGVSVVKSYATMWHLLPFAGILKWAYYLSARSCAELCEGLGINETIMPRKMMTYHELGCMVWASNVRQYLIQTGKGIPLKGVRYEDMTSDTEYAMKQVFTFLALEYDPQAVESAFSKDSQVNTPLDREKKPKTQRFVSETLTPKDEADLSGMCERFEVPDFREDIVLPGTITHRIV